MKRSSLIILISFCSIIHLSANTFKNFSKVEGGLSRCDTIPSLNEDDNNCSDYIGLSKVEANTNKLYWASKKVQTQDNYSISADHKIIMKAGDAVILKANSIIKQGANYLARIEPCKNPCNQNVSYPNYFTPNGDGINDNWKIYDVSDVKDLRIVIFDRYGKLIKSLSENNLEWDGTYNSVSLPSSDYWFRMFYIDCNGEHHEIRSHFALKR